MDAKMKLKHLSTIANDVVYRCALKLITSVDALEDDFKIVWSPEQGDYSRKFVEYCSTKALKETCSSIGEPIADVSFSRFTFDVMLAWQTPSSHEEQSNTESVGKEREDRRVPTAAVEENEDVSIFYSDIMPLLVDHEPGVKDDAFVWFASLFPLCGDVVNGRFTFETLTAATAYRLHFPAYDKFLKEVNRCVRHLQKQHTPTGVELAEEEFILHVEGTTGSQRVVRHVGESSWGGRLTLTNYALYFEAAGAVSYEGALKIDLSKNTEQSVKPTSTGPWGVPLFDKAIVYQSSELSEEIVLEFPEMTSSTRRGHWLALIREIMLLHQFLAKHKLEASAEGWEMQARTMLAIIRLHAAREMLRMAPPVPKSFLIFTLLDELPKGDYILQELAESLKQITSDQPCSSCAILTSLRASHDNASPLSVSPIASIGDILRPDVVREDVVDKSMKVEDDSSEKEEVLDKDLKGEDGGSRKVADQISSLDEAIVEAREEEEEIEIAKATTEVVKEEGVTDSFQVLLELLKPVKSSLIWFQEVLKWERPNATVSVVAAILLISYKEWVEEALAACLLWAAWEILRARKRRVKDKYDKVVVCTASDKTSMENIISAQHGLINAHDLVHTANIALLKFQSLLVSRTEKHTDLLIVGIIGVAIVLAFIPFKYIIMVATLSIFTSTSKLGKKVGKTRGDKTSGDRRLKEWWDSIPIVPIEIVNDLPRPQDPM